MSREEKNPDAILIPLQKSLSVQGDIGSSVRMFLNLNDDRTVASSEFLEGYNHAVRTVYSALCLLNIEGREAIDPKEIRVFKKCLEDYVTGKR